MAASMIMKRGAAQAPSSSSTKEGILSILLSNPELLKPTDRDYKNWVLLGMDLGVPDPQLQKIKKTAKAIVIGTGILHGVVIDVITEWLKEKTRKGEEASVKDLIFSLRKNDLDTFADAMESAPNLQDEAVMAVQPGASSASSTFLIKTDADIEDEEESNPTELYSPPPPPVHHSPPKKRNFLQQGNENARRHYPDRDDIRNYYDKSTDRDLSSYRNVAGGSKGRKRNYDASGEDDDSDGPPAAARKRFQRSSFDSGNGSYQQKHAPLQRGTGSYDNVGRSKGSARSIPSPLPMYFSPFHQAVIQNRIADVLYFIRQPDVDINERAGDRFRSTALHLASWYIENLDEALEMIKILIQKGCRVDTKNTYQYTFANVLLFSAKCSKSNINSEQFHKLVKILIDSGNGMFLVTPIFKRGDGILHQAMQVGVMSKQSVQYLHLRREVLNYESQAGYSILYYAIVGKRSMEMIRTLLQCGADWRKYMDEKEKEWNLLHAAAKSGNLEAFEFFYKKKRACIRAKDKCGNTPIDIFKKYHYGEEAKLERIMGWND